MACGSLVMIAGSFSRKHGIALAALVDGTLVALGVHVVNETALSSECSLTIFALEVVVALEVTLQLSNAAVANTAELTRRPMAFVRHMEDHFLVEEELCAARVTFVEGPMDHSLGGTA